MLTASNENQAFVSGLSTQTITENPAAVAAAAALTDGALRPRKKPVHCRPVGPCGPRIRCGAVPAALIVPSGGAAAVAAVPSRAKGPRLRRDWLAATGHHLQ